MTIPQGLLSCIPILETAKSGGDLLVSIWFGHSPSSDLFQSGCWARKMIDAASAATFRDLLPDEDCFSALVEQS